MNDIPRVFHKFSSQVWYLTIIPVFFFAFVLLYTPGWSEGFLDAGRGIRAFNVTMCMCIILGCLAISRVSFYFIWRKRSLSLITYSAFCVGEVVVMSLFCGLYMWLMLHRTIPYLSAVGKMMEICASTLIYPYLTITMALYLSDKTERTDEIPKDTLVRFPDSQQRMKLVIASSAILYIEADENYVRIHYLESGVEKEFLLRNSMKKIDELVSRYGLLRCHRSFLINPAHVKMLKKGKEGVLQAELDECPKPVPVSKRYYDNLASLL
ncbi:MAG: LytTR family DNA-binding domain-containing protein [Candidatus Cryptobacteroides sp.]